MDKFVQIRGKYKKKILLKDEKEKPLLIHHSNAFTFTEGNEMYDHFNTLDWKTQEVKIVGKWVKQARETFAYSKNGKTYTYSGLKIQPQLYDNMITFVQNRIKKLCNQQCDYYLCNRYNNIKNYISEHSDDESDLDPKSSIISISLGQKRRFVIRIPKNKTTENPRKPVLIIEMKHGDIIEMCSGFQSRYTHSIPKITKTEKKNITHDYRINLTGRILKIKSS
jgi:alkylated DNA repair dioxygenase AlkB